MQHGRRRSFWFFFKVWGSFKILKYMRHRMIYFDRNNTTQAPFLKRRRKEVNLGAANTFCRKTNMSWEQKKKIQGITKVSFFLLALSFSE